jgi:NADH-quinone oxidoreductase subunit N
VTMLGALGVITVLSGSDRDADQLDDYRGLFWRRPWLAGVFTAALLSLAGMPLTGGFLGEFYLADAGVGAGLWALVIVLVLSSAIGLFYYLRIVGTMCSRPAEETEGSAVLPSLSLVGAAVLASLTLVLVWLGVYPAPLIDLIQATASRLG